MTSEEILAIEFARKLDDYPVVTIKLPRLMFELEKAILEHFDAYYPTTISEMAKAVGIGRTTLDQKLRKLGLIKTRI